MMTPVDIETADFKKVALGYSCDEVDTFLDKVIVEFENDFSKKMLNFRIRLLQQKRHLNITRI